MFLALETHNKTKLQQCRSDKKIGFNNQDKSEFCTIIDNHRFPSTSFINNLPDDLYDKPSNVLREVIEKFPSQIMERYMKDYCNSNENWEWSERRHSSKVSFCQAIMTEETYWLVLRQISIFSYNMLEINLLTYILDSRVIIKF